MLTYAPPPQAFEKNKDIEELPAHFLLYRIGSRNAKRAETLCALRTSAERLLPSRLAPGHPHPQCAADLGSAGHCHASCFGAARLSLSAFCRSSWFKAREPGPFESKRRAGRRRSPALGPVALSNPAPSNCCESGYREPRNLNTSRSAPLGQWLPRCDRGSCYRKRCLLQRPTCVLGQWLRPSGPE